MVVLTLLFGSESLLWCATAWAQEEVASSIRRYRQRELSTGYYEEYEVKPRRQRALVEIPGLRGGFLPYSPSAAAAVQIRTRLADSHRGLKFYERRRCADCHVQETKNIHTVRNGLTCRQCHGVEPIASINYYYSPMNPVRRHAYVCSKCHEGANASFAAYIVHAPNPALIQTKREFPVLFYVFWIMITLSVGIFVVFLPHTLAWNLRELFQKRKDGTDHEDQG